uniref:NADH dehydrogenase [ubiquinone] 1 alpha subcomplex subunit 11 n=1 Tax=Sinocyclocheilus grahami TaxID=75366 RepID=A0A672RB81_SINGR
MDPAKEILFLRQGSSTIEEYTGLVGSAYHIVAYPPETAVEALTRATSGTATMAAMGAIFGLATCLSAQARDAPDDPTNYFIGGCASGIFLGARTHSAITGTTACFGLGTLAMFTKIGKKEGWRLTPGGFDTGLYRGS